jgi:hypothetical protein
MSKRRWRDNGLEDLGISRSTVKDLEGVERVDAAIDRAAASSSRSVRSSLWRYG